MGKAIGGIGVPTEFPSNAGITTASDLATQKVATRKKFRRPEIIGMRLVLH